MTADRPQWLSWQTLGFHSRWDDAQDFDPLLLHSMTHAAIRAAARSHRAGDYPRALLISKLLGLGLLRFDFETALGRRCLRWQSGRCKLATLFMPRVAMGALRQTK